jgi:flagellar basal body L-ring protein FlgH
MRIRPLLTLFLLLFPLALCSCATVAQQPVALACPKPQPVPAPLMQQPPKPLQTGSQLQSKLFQSVTPQTPAKDNLVHK